MYKSIRTGVYMKTGEITVRDCMIGSGMPKICIPIVGSTQEEIFAQAEHLKTLSCDMAEWRVDWFEEYKDKEARMSVLAGIREILGNTPIIATLRTKREGGNKEIDFPAYARVNLSMAKSGYVDFIDVEAFSFGEISEELIGEAHRAGVYVIASNHDFKKTPPKEEMVNRLLKMQEMGADIAKIAVMPQAPKDVLALLEATEEMVREYATIPIITMSMSALGGISRLSGEIFGSAVTFASAGKSSAPGQMDVGEMRQVLRLLHQGLQDRQP